MGAGIIPVEGQAERGRTGRAQKPHGTGTSSPLSPTAMPGRGTGGIDCQRWDQSIRSAAK